jgi:hypothetical protein
MQKHILILLVTALLNLNYPLAAVSIDNKRDNNTDIVSQCEFYQVKLQELQCTEDNYLNRFAYKYCREYTLTNSDYSEAGQVILQNIRSCLIENIRDAKNLKCENTEDIGYSSHVDCYISSGYCDIQPDDKALMVLTASQQMFNFKLVTMFLEIENECDFRNSIYSGANLKEATR